MLRLFLAFLPVKQLGPLTAPLDLTEPVTPAFSHLLQARVVLSLTLTNPLSHALLNRGANSRDLGTNEKTHLCPCCLPFHTDTAAGRVGALPMGTSCILPVGTGGPRLTFPTPFSVPSLCLRISSHTRVSLLCPLPSFFNFFTSLPRKPCYSLDSCPLLHPAPVLPRATTLTHSCPEPLETFLQKSTTFRLSPMLS